MAATSKKVRTMTRPLNHGAKKLTLCFVLMKKKGTQFYTLFDVLKVFVLLIFYFQVNKKQNFRKPPTEGIFLF